MGNINLLYENIGAFIDLNGEIHAVRHYVDNVRDEGGWDASVAYEVVRVVRGVPMFFEDHCTRMNESLSRMNVNAQAGISALQARITSLLLVNGIASCNVKIWAAPAAAFEPAPANTATAAALEPTPADPADQATAAAHGPRQSEINIFMNINKSFYPPPEYYRDGVAAGLLEYTRDAPNIKRLVAGFKERIQSMIDNEGVFEVLLYDSSRLLTEGSRSNLFFTRDGIIYTAPDHMILKGTIRKYVYIAAERAGIQIVEEPARLDSVIEAVDANEGPGKRRGCGAFITGTSIGVLPVSTIGGCRINSEGDEVIKKLMEEYASIEQKYINERNGQA